MMTARAGRMLRKIRNFTIPARSSLEFIFFIMRLPASIPVQAPGMMTAPKIDNVQLEFIVNSHKFGKHLIDLLSHLNPKPAP